MDQKQIDQSIRLKILIKALNLNQLSFSKSVGMAQPNISKMMNGERQLSIELLNRIAERHKANLHWLLTGDGEIFVDDVQDTSLHVKEDPAIYGKDKRGELEERLERLEKAFKRLAKDLA